MIMIRKKYTCFLFVYLMFLLGYNLPAYSQQLEPLSYNNPDLLVDLGVGLWAWPLPMDYNDNGLTDLVVVCTDTPYKGVYFFENTGVMDTETKLPVYKPSQHIGEAVNNLY